MSCHTLLATASISAALSLMAAAPAQAQTVLATTNSIIEGSLCVGFDCASGIAFGFDTVILKENNLRLLFDDTSSTASFPNNDWRLTANDSANGGRSYFRIEDSTAGHAVFEIAAGARSNALTVDAQGDVGIGLRDAVVDLHIRTGNTPTLRLEQGTGNGFTPQTWDLAGNEANFFIRDATNGSQLPFRIEPGAPSNAIYVDSTDGNIGMGTTSPDDALDVDGGASSVAMRLTTTDGAWRFNHNANTDRLNINYTGTGGNTPFKIASTADENLLQLGTNASNQMDVGGNLVISGTVTVGATQVHPDYVFAPDYELMPLSEVEAFVIANRHLPRIPSAAEVQANGLNMTQMQMSLLEKVEELTLYTLEQEDMIGQLMAQLEQQGNQIEAQGQQIKMLSGLGASR